MTFGASSRAAWWNRAASCACRFASRTDHCCELSRNEASDSRSA